MNTDGYVRKDWKQMLLTAVGWRQSVKIYPRQGSNTERVSVCLVSPEYKAWVAKVKTILENDVEHYSWRGMGDILGELAEIEKSM